MTVVYNEIDPFAVEWLRNLIARDLIEPGEVLDTDILQLSADRVRGSRQAHFFAGIGVWSYALRLAGWPANVPVWTGSCPCQPFSGAGRGRGTEDPRHLWPAWRDLIDECRPPVILGEQVASPAGREWLGSVQVDMEALGYSFGAADLCAAGVGAPHVRQRLFFVAVAQGQGLEDRLAQGSERPERSSDSVRRLEDPDRERRDGLRLRLQSRGSQQEGLEAPGRGKARGLWHSDRKHTRRDGRAAPGPEDQGGRERRETRGLSDSDRVSGRAGWLADSPGQGWEGRDRGQERKDRPLELERPGPTRDLADPDRQGRVDGSEPGGRGLSGPSGRGSTRGFWAPADWLYCRDEKARPVEPGSFPLAHGVAGRVAARLPEGSTEEAHEYNRRGALQGLGNAIVPQVAAEFVRAVIEAIGQGRQTPGGKPNSSEP